MAIKMYQQLVSVVSDPLALSDDIGYDKNSVNKEKFDGATVGATLVELEDAVAAAGATLTGLENAVEDKQDKLKSGSNIKTINGESLLGSGDIKLQTEMKIGKNLIKDSNFALGTPGGKNVIFGPWLIFDGVNNSSNTSYSDVLENFPNSGDPRGAQLYNINWGQNVKVKPGKTYTLSFMYVSSSGSGDYFDFGHKLDSLVTVVYTNLSANSQGLILSSRTPSKAVITIKTPDSSSSEIEIPLTFAATTDSNTSYCTIGQIQLEEGTIATEYSPEEYNILGELDGRIDELESTVDNKIDKSELIKNFVINGDFSQNSTSMNPGDGWKAIYTHLRNPSSEIKLITNAIGEYNAFGFRYNEFGQTIDGLIPGNTYTLSFKYEIEYYLSDAYLNVGPYERDASVENLSSENIITSSNMSYESTSFSMQGTSWYGWKLNWTAASSGYQTATITFVAQNSTMDINFMNCSSTAFFNVSCVMLEKGLVVHDYTSMGSIWSIAQDVAQDKISKSLNSNSNLLVNADFSELDSTGWATGWSKYGTNSIGAKFNTDNGTSYIPGAFLCWGDDYGIKQNVSLKAGKKYVLTFLHTIDGGITAGSGKSYEYPGSQVSVGSKSVITSLKNEFGSDLTLGSKGGINSSVISFYRTEDDNCYIEKCILEFTSTEDQIAEIIFAGFDNDGNGNQDSVFANLKLIEVGSGGTIKDKLDEKQETLVSGTNIKTVNGISLLGEGNLEIQAGTEITLGSGLKNDNFGAVTVSLGSGLKNDNFGAVTVSLGTGLNMDNATGNIYIDDSALNDYSVGTTADILPESYNSKLGNVLKLNLGTKTNYNVCVGTCESYFEKNPIYLDLDGFKTFYPGKNKYAEKTILLKAQDTGHTFGTGVITLDSSVITTWIGDAYIGTEVLEVFLKDFIQLEVGTGGGDFDSVTIGTNSRQNWMDSQRIEFSPAYHNGSVKMKIYTFGEEFVYQHPSTGKVFDFGNLCGGKYYISFERLISPGYY